MGDNRWTSRSGGLAPHDRMMRICTPTAIASHRRDVRLAWTSREPSGRPHARKDGRTWPGFIVGTTMTSMRGVRFLTENTADHVSSPAFDACGAPRPQGVRAGLTRTSVR